MTEAAAKITALSTEEKPIYGSGLFYCYNGQNQSVIQRFGTGYMIEGDAENGLHPQPAGQSGFGRRADLDEEPVRQWLQPQGARH